jgi:hypothetical protein
MPGLINNVVYNSTPNPAGEARPLHHPNLASWAKRVTTAGDTFKAAVAAVSDVRNTQ